MKHKGEDCRRVQLAMQDTLHVVNGKWKFMILSILIRTGKKRFGELVKETGISPRILSKELQEMELNQLVTRKVCDTKPVTVEYACTTFAGTLKDVIGAMIKWGEAHRKRILKGQHQQDNPEFSAEGYLLGCSNN